MKVILLEKVTALGNVGEIVNVSGGHARNFLLPKKLAVLADEKNNRILEDQKRRLAKKVQAEKNKAVEVKGKIDGLKFEFIRRVGSNGKLFGTITTSDLSKELAKLGIEVERKYIAVDRPIKQLGSYEVKVKLFTDVNAEFSVKVVMDETQIKEMKKLEAEAKLRKAEEKKQQEEAKSKEKVEAEKTEE